GLGASAQAADAPTRKTTTLTANAVSQEARGRDINSPLRVQCAAHRESRCERTFRGNWQHLQFRNGRFTKKGRKAGERLGVVRSPDFSDQLLPRNREDSWDLTE